MGLQRIATRLGQEAIKLAGKLTAVNARRLARKAAERIMKTYSKKITQGSLAMDIAKQGVKYEGETAMKETITQAT